ncbi:uroporphyrinogen decarboxylase family protein [candidate division KSB1 bacterium]
MIKPKTFIPVDVVFHPSWWHHHYGISFRESFFFDPETRISAESAMRRALAERFGDLGLGDPDPKPKPIVGPVHLAAGFITAEMLGCDVNFFDDASPEVVPRNLTEDELAGFQPPDLDRSPRFNDFVKLMDSLEARFGRIEGDINWAGIHNDAVNLRGQEWFLDYYSNPRLVERTLDLLRDFAIDFVSHLRRRTGTSSLSVNRIIDGIEPGINLHSNCTVTMISPEIYRQFLLPRELELCQALSPYGIHHCGTNMHVYAADYARVTEAVFFDVGWGSDLAQCRRDLPDRILSLRLGPAWLARSSVEEIIETVTGMLSRAGDPELAAVCAVNLDRDTSDDNVRAVFEAVQQFRQKGA